MLALDKGEKLPFDLEGQTLYYMGVPSGRARRVRGTAGTNDRGRMNVYSTRVSEAGIRARMGKGSRSPAVREAIKKYKAVYFATTGGAGALLANSVRQSEVIAYEDLGAEAILRLEVENFPAIVANDIYGGDLFEQGKARYQRGRH